MNAQNAKDPEAVMELQCDLENFVITDADEEAIRDAVEQQLREPPVHAEEQN